MGHTFIAKYLIEPIAEYIFLMSNSETNLKFILLAGTILVLLLVTFVMVFLYMYQRRHMAYYLEKKSMESVFANELAQARLDQHEESMKRLGDDLHDQMSQVMAAVMQDLSMIIVKITDREDPLEVIEKTKENLYQLHQSVRVISKSMSATTLEGFGLLEALKEQELLSNRPGRTPLKIELIGTTQKLNPQVELILYRMVQESIGNAMRYAKATHIEILMVYGAEEVEIKIRDDGKGFDKRALDNSPRGGSGLGRLSKRAKNIGARLNIESTLNVGTSVSIFLPYSQHLKNT